jgi:hypothetical protein
MDIFQIIGHLETMGVNLTLAIDYEGNITPEAETLLQALSKDREAAIDCLAGRRFAPLPDNMKLPPQFQSERMKQIQHIFRVCFTLLEKHEGAETEEQWKAAATFCEGKLDPKDRLATDMHIACYTELHRQHKKGRGDE